MLRADSEDEQAPLRHLDKFHQAFKRNAGRDDFYGHYGGSGESSSGNNDGQGGSNGGSQSEFGK